MASELEPEQPKAPSRPVGRFMLRGGMWVAATQALGTGCATLNQLMLARLLVPDALGAFYLVQSIVIPASQLSQLGMVRPVTRLVAEAKANEDEEQAGAFIRSALRLALLAGLGVALLYVLVGGRLARDVFDTPQMVEGTMLAALWTLAVAFQQISSAGLRGVHRVGIAAFVAESGSKIITAGALLALLVFAGGVHFTTVLGVAVSAAGGMAILGVVMLAPHAIGAARKSGTHAILLHASMPLVATGVVHVALNSADLWIVGARFTPDHVALYGAAKRLILIISLPLMLLPLVIPPVIADLHTRGDSARLQRVIQGSATLSGIPALLLLSLFALASGPVLGFTFGEFYRDASSVLMLLSLERAVFVWVGPCALTLLMTGHETTLMKITVSMGIVTVGLVYLGVVLLDFPGAAVGFAIGSIAHQLLLWSTTHRRVGIRTNMGIRQLPQAIDAVRRAWRG